MTLLGNLASANRRQATDPCPRRAIIDIGSNSIRLVVYDGPRRSPFILFNEKVMAGLGAGLAETGAIGAEPMERGLRALRRFALLARQMDAKIRCVATAAVRDATNGDEFAARARSECGLPVEILSGRQEAEAAAYGVIGSIPDIDGVVGDLGGGSLELARVRGGQVEDVLSLPLGVLRLAQIRKQGKAALKQTLVRELKKGGWKIEPDLPFFMVGGSWRALARLDMELLKVPLPVIHQHDIAPDRAAHLLRVIAHTPKANLRDLPGVPNSRTATLGDAAALLGDLVRVLGCSRLVVSSHGLREGLLYQELDEAERLLDPLLIAAQAEGDAQGRFAGHGPLIDHWIAPLFEGDSADAKRIRMAACHLGDVGWRANPDFRAERGVEIALHSNWVAIDNIGRGQLAQALFANFGGATILAKLEKLATPEALERARQWGLAIRLAQRLSGGVAAPLKLGRIAVEQGSLRLSLPQMHAALYGESVQRRHRQLAVAMGLEHDFCVVG